MTAGRLPNLLIVGVPKAGTTSLFGYLTQHPQICGSDVKEIGFFHAWDPRGRPTKDRPDPDAYRAHFTRCREERYALEATPSYCYGGQPVIDAIREVLGTPRIIVLLRDPTERLWSAYAFQRSKGNLAGIRSFEEYVDQAAAHFQSGTDRADGRRLQGLATGFYADYIPLWIAAFGEHLKVIFAESLSKDRQSALDTLFEWLDLAPLDVGQLDLASRNVTVHARSTRMAGLVYRLKRGGDRIGLLPRALRGPLRRVYLRVNTGAPSEQLSPAMRARVDEIYRVSNRATAAALRSHGTGPLPPWLERHAD